MSSRFLNLLVRNLNRRCLPYNVHRLNPENLFYPTRSPEPKTFEDSPEIEDVLRPPARLNFAWPCVRQGDFGSMDFMSFGRSSGDNILSVDNYGRTFLYKFISGTFHTVMPVPPKRIMDHITFAVGDDLYVLGRDRGSALSFMALIDGDSAGSATRGWYWKSLHPPSFGYSYGNLSCSDEDQVEDPFQITAYTVVGVSEILITAEGAAGTYSSDVASGDWNKAWEWALPFRGGAVYVPEHNLWFGISDQGQQLCAFNLTALIKHRPPVTQNLGKVLVDPPKNCTLRKTKLLPLGAGRLGIAKFFRTEPPLELRYDELYAYTPEYFVVLTGVEVLDDCNGKGLHMIRHKSNRYSFGKNLVDPL